MADAYEQLLRKIQAGLQQKMAGEQAAGEQEESLLFPGQTLEEASHQQQQYEEKKQKQHEKERQQRLQQRQEQEQKQQQQQKQKQEQEQQQHEQAHHPETQDKTQTQDTSFKSLYDGICNRIRATGVLDAIMEEFQEQKTDLERVQYVSQMSEIQNFSLKENYAQKSTEDAANYEKVYDMLVPNEASANKALDVIKKCLLKTPPEDTLALATRYMKRGWTYLLLEQFDNAKVDAMKSLSFKCPDEQMWNAYEILGHCYAMSKDYKEAEAQFLKALENLRKSNIPNEVKAATTVRIMSVFKSVKGKKQKKASSAAAGKPASKHVPQLSYGINKRFPSASSAVNFVRSPMMGRCAIAQRDIKPGDILIIDAPYVTMMNADVCGNHCYNCFSYCPCPIPCSSCAKVSYCSDSCYATSWEQQHKMECKVLNHLMDPEIGKVALLVFRALVMVSWSKLQKLKEKLLTVIDEEKCEAPHVVEEEASSDCETTPTPISWEGKYQPKDYMTVFHLITNSNKRSFGDLLKRSITALYICQCLKLGGFFGKEEPQEEDVLFVAALALRHLQGASCNAYEISEYDTTEHSTNELGGAFYTTVSLTNHSCKSNAIRYSVGDKCILRAIRFIPRGSEVFDNYGFQYYSNPVVERQEVLLNQYKFKCLCEACAHNWPLYPHHQMETLILRCPAPKCRQPFCFSTSIRSKCNMCGNIQQYTKLVQEADAQLIHHKDCLGAMRKGNTSAALAGLLSHQIFLDQHVVEPAKHYTDVVELIRNCYAQMGNVYSPHEAAPVAEAPKPQGQKLKAKKSKYVNPR